MLYREIFRLYYHTFIFTHYTFTTDYLYAEKGHFYAFMFECSSLFLDVSSDSGNVYFVRLTDICLAVLSRQYISDMYISMIYVISRAELLI